MKNFTKIGLLSALAVVALSVPSCKKTNDVKTDPVAEPTGSNGKLSTQSINANLIAFWPMDGNGDDLSGNGHNASITGSVTGTTDHFGIYGRAMHFDNSIPGSFMTVTDAADLRLTGTDYTINAWVRLDNYNASYGSQILSKRTSAPDGWGCSITGNLYGSGPGLSFIGIGAHGTGNARSIGAIGTGMPWHMVTYVFHYGTTVFDMYIDGVLDSQPVAGTSTSYSTANLTIGYDGALSNYYFNGDMDDIRIYNKALSAADITDLKNQTAPDVSIAYYPFDGSAADFSGNSLNGTPFNVSSVADHYTAMGTTNGSAYGFNGSSSYVYVPDNAALRLNTTNFSLNAWVKINSIGAPMQIMAKRSSTGDGWGWSVTNTGKTFFGPGGTSPSLYGTTTLTTGTWHMVTIIYQKINSTTGYLFHFVDGYQAGPGIATFPPPGASVTDPLVIGRDNLSSNYFFNGSIDDVRIYQRALTQGELTFLYYSKY